ncbi:MAG TPA: DUF2971 domain-containing protein [Pyrinomonadaceae bacterium]|nr:DUF2971 domain-containing protein [Pyrinomonadaceae bacterium]
MKLFREWTHLHVKRPRILYHYTDATGLLGMLKTHRLWATNRRFLNDPTETSYAAEVILEVTDGKQAESYLAKRIPNGLRRKRVADQVRATIREIVSAYVNQDEHYLACFCENGDLLSQWRGYGSVGGGYAVGFVAEHLGLVQYQNVQKPEPIVQKVIYDPAVQQRITLKWLKFIIDWQNFCLESNERAKVDALDKGWLWFNWYLSQSLRCYKHPAYAEEAEWRVIQVGTAPEGGRAIQPNFRSGRRGIVEYVELNLPGVGDRLPLEIICYGPTLDPTITDRSLSLLCRGKGYENVSITKSQVPFAG